MKTKFLICILLTQCNAFFLNAQLVFQKTYGTAGNSDYGLNCRHTGDGGYIIVGVTAEGSTSTDDIYLMKIDSSGSMQWNKSFEKPGPDHGNDVVQTPDNGFVITGSSRDSLTGYDDVLILKTDAQGNLLWLKLIGGPYYDEGFSIQSTYDGGFIIAAITQSFTFQTNNYAYLIKVDSSGNVQWKHSYGDPGTTIETFSAIQTTDSCFVIAGTTTSQGSWLESQLIKTDVNGALLWSKKYGSADGETIGNVKQTSDGGFIATGKMVSLTSLSSSVNLYRMDAQGNLLWVKNYDGHSSDYSYSVDQTTDGGFIISGSTESFAAQGNSDMYLIKTNDSGSIVWAKIYGTLETSLSYCAHQSMDSSYFLCGLIVAPGAESEVYFVKTDSLGNSGCNDSIVSFTETNLTLSTNILSPSTNSGGMISTTSLLVSGSAVENTLCASTNIVIKPELNFQIFPNPVTENFTIHFDEHQEHLEIKIINNMGELVHTEKNLRGKELRIRLPNLADGIYIVQVTNSRDFFSRKIIVINFR